eukprot:CAMPEP_0185908342 /NCGR_PEP_ID=MMETSP0196C-20130402/8668_1 /TAXON_ID=2932 /ORGANISM="Alexandrium fundyense, Strain CCMP1719" /LENGTH=98 /DNA_ID=CAMNT_0028628553 /DNA_START=135 /DNA_END=426 /DNA_ORIENTATION=+
MPASRKTALKSQQYEKKVGKASTNSGSKKEKSPFTVGPMVLALCLAVALGLVVGLAGVGLPGSAKAEDVAAPADYDIRTGQSEKEQEAWNKAKFKIWA